LDTLKYAFIMVSSKALQAKKGYSIQAHSNTGLRREGRIIQREAASPIG